MKKSRIKKINPLFIVVSFIFTIYAATLLYPYIWGGISSLKTPAEYYDPFSFPEKLQFINYKYAIENMSVEGISFLEMVWNSVWFSVGSTIITIAMQAITAYVLAIYDFKGKKIINAVFLFIMVYPIYGSFPATYRLYHQLRMVDSYFILLSAFCGVSTNLLILVGYFRNLSKEYMDAAQIDGAGPLKTFCVVMLPQAMTMISVLFLLMFLGNWNNYMSAMLYLPNKLTLAAGLYKYQEVAQRKGNFPIYFAASFIFVIPCFVLFFLLRDKIMTSISFGGLKG